MARPPVILALDLGTSNVKAIALDVADGSVVASAERAIDTERPVPDAAEQDPDELGEAAAAAVSEVAGGLTRPIVGLGLSCAMHGVLALGADGRPIGRLRTWADGRGAGVARRLRERGPWAALQARTGTPVDASSPLCKIAALREDEPDCFARAAAFVSGKELLLRDWCGAAVVDHSLASATGLFDLRRAAWDEDALALAGIGAERLSRIVPTTQVLRSWRPGVAARLGLPPDLPLVVGASDGCLANLGCGAVADGLVAVTIGTSGAARRLVAQPGVPPSSGLFCYALDEGQWIVGGAVNDGGDALVWAGDLLFADRAADQRVPAVLDAAATAPGGARGARFRPGLAGTRFPDYDRRPHAMLEGLSIAQRRADLCRAVVEGVVDGIGAVVDALVARCGAAVEIRAGGGVLRSELVGRLLARRCGVRVAVVDAGDASALGAARLALRALGREQPPWPEPDSVFEPEPD